MRAALLGARLLSTVAHGLGIPIEKCHAWSDNKTVLCWLHTDGTTGSEYVDNYVSHIHKIAPGVSWHYVPTKENPADVASRGCNAEQLLQDKMWWKGPQWLSQPPDCWPNVVSSGIVPLTSNLPAEPIINCFVTQETRLAEPKLFLERFSSLDKLLKVVVNCRRLLERRIGIDVPAPLASLTVPERQQAFLICVRLSQSKHHENELKMLSKGKPIVR